jgi:hypothetical protein
MMRDSIFIFLVRTEEFAMNAEKSIKIIKGNQRNADNKDETSQPPSEKSSRTANRQIAGQVAGWIQEFQQRRHTESLSTFASLFLEPSSPVNQTS